MWQHWNKLVQLLTTELSGDKFVPEFKSDVPGIEFYKDDNGTRMSTSFLLRLSSNKTMDLMGHKKTGKSPKFTAVKLCRLNIGQLDDEGLEEIAQSVASIIRDTNS